jgi:hypothetical protein
MRLQQVITGALLLALGMASTPATAQQATTHAALAIDRKAGSLYGWAVDHPSPQAARDRAREECVQRGGSCEVVLEFSGGCGAYAVERGNESLYGWATAGDRAGAEGRALEEARTRGGKDVLVRVWGCNSGPLGEGEAAPATGGVHFVYPLRVTRGETVKLCFVSNVFHVDNVAVRSGDRWTWQPDAGNQLAPYVARFTAAVQAREPGTQVDLQGGWRGGNELDFEMLPAAAGDLGKRRERLRVAIDGFAADCRTRGYEVVSITL